MANAGGTRKLLMLGGYVQFLVTAVVVLFYPLVEVQVFTVSASPGLNLSHHACDHVQLHPVTLLYPLPVLATSLLGAFLCSSTVALLEQGLSGADFTQEALDEGGVWNMLFWAYSALAHALAVMLLLSPGDAYQGVLGVLLMTYFLCRITAPKTQEITITLENFYLLGYALGFVLVLYGMPADASSSGMRYYIIFVVGVIDYCLGVGHTWDRQATFDTVAHCRLFYIYAQSVCICAIYAAWNDQLLHLV